MSEALPPPQRELFRALRRGDVYALATPTRLARVFPTAGAHPVAWNQFRAVGPLTTGRFDPHVPGRERGIWYGAASQQPDGRPADAVLGALAETCADTHTIDRAVNARTLVVCSPARLLRLLRLDSSWLSAAHGNAALWAGPRAVAQAWSRAIYDQYPELDGVSYPSSNHPGSRCVALFERAADALRTPTLLRPLTDPGLLPYLVRASDELGWPLT